MQMQEQFEELQIDESNTDLACDDAPAAAAAHAEAAPPRRQTTGSDPSKKHALDIKGAGREASMADYDAFMAKGAGAQLSAIRRPLEPDTAVRVVAVRHGMGHHNDAFQAASFMNRDAELNRVGISQATETGRMLRDAGLFDQQPLLVVSPFCRTLQTLLRVVGTDAWDHPTVLQPLAGETSVASRLPGPRLARKVVANVQQGDHGSTAAELARKFGRHAQFDFGALDEYCARMGSKWAAGGEHEGKWWHHGHHGKIEMNEHDAVARSAELRAWLASEAIKRGIRVALLVSHGGMLKQTFGTETFANGEFRCFDLTESGDYKPCVRTQ
jgi:broad specificity phosphatase PhoE